MLVMWLMRFGVTTEEAGPDLPAGGPQTYSCAVAPWNVWGGRLLLPVPYSVASLRCFRWPAAEPAIDA